MSGERAPASLFFRLSLISYLVMFAVGAGIAAWQGHLRSWVEPATFWSDAALGIATGLAIVLISRPATRIPAARKVALELGEAIQGLELWQLALLALFSGIGEEALFRGILAPQWTLGMVVATAVFAVVHIGRAWRFLWWTAFALAVGFLFAGLYVWRGTLVASMLAHFVVNLINLPYLSRLYRETSSLDR